MGWGRGLGGLGRGAAANPTHIRSNFTKHQFEVMHLINLMMPRRQLGHEWGKRRHEGGRRRDIWKMGGKWQLQSVQSMHKFLHVRKVAAAFQNFSTLLPFESFE